MSRLLVLLAALTMLVTACGEDPTVDDAATGEDPPAAGPYDVADQPDEAAASFTAPADGDTTTSPVSLAMSAEGIEIVPAGTPEVGQGHFHVAVDADCVGEGESVPGPGEEAEAEGYHHFGDGSSEAELELEPGTHDLCLQLADGAHTALGATDTVTITVE